MAQSVDLSVSGLYTSSNDFNGLPPGALEVADNVETKYKKILEPRRGFQGLPGTLSMGERFIRLIKFPVNSIYYNIGLTDAGTLKYWNTTWQPLPGNYSTGIAPPDPVYAKSRFRKANQNLYVTTKYGVVSFSPGPTGKTVPAGVPKALNLEANVTGDLLGFLGQNQVLATTGNITSGAASLLALNDTSGIIVGQYVAGITIYATATIQDITYTSLRFGSLGSTISIEYTTGGTAGSEVVTVGGIGAISVQIQSGVSTATQVIAAVLGNTAAAALVSAAITGTAGTAQTAPVAPTTLTGGIDNTIPVGTKVLSIDEPATVIIQTGTTTAGSTNLTALASNVGIVSGLTISGTGIPDGTTVASISGAGPYTVVMSQAAYQTATSVNVTFTTPVHVTMNGNAVTTLTNTPIYFYSGSQVGYRIVYGRTETDLNGNTITRLGPPSPIAIAYNTYPHSTNVKLTATLPKHAQERISFYQLYRSTQTPSIAVSPLDQYKLVQEVELTPTNFGDRFVTIEDSTVDSFAGIALYAGSDQEGVSQSNDPPPMAWDICPFREFMIYGNVTRPTTLKVTILGVGSPNGVQIGDTITISGWLRGSFQTQTYTASSNELGASREFRVFTSGTPAQNIADTANSLIRVINYDEGLSVHAVLLSGATDLGGQILLEACDPGLSSFTVIASAHTDAYDPPLTGVTSDVNSVPNGLLISKSGQFEAVPITNLAYAGDSSSPILRVIPLRDYVFVIKTDGIYKLQGYSPNGITISPFDLTTRIIGSDTAVSFNSSLWMFSNQGVVSVSDGGVEAKSIPIDDQLTTLKNQYLTEIQTSAFAVGYESDRKYILSLPTSADLVTNKQFIFNYITSAWTTWSRRLETAYIDTLLDLLIISRGDVINTLSQERKTGSYLDYVDEGIPVTITALISPHIVQLDDVTNVQVGDILYQSAEAFSPITSIDLVSSLVTLSFSLSFTATAAEVRSAYECNITWKQVFGDNPAFVKQFPEGLALFKRLPFTDATLSFITDYSVASALVPIQGGGIGNGLWGLFPWATLPWGSISAPQNIRFLIPQDKQLGSYLIPSFKIRQGLSHFEFQGLSITYQNQSSEVGK